MEVERKNHTINLEQGQAMEKHKSSMIGEINSLRAELANAQKRAMAAAAAAANRGPGYGTMYVGSNMVHGSFL